MPWTDAAALALAVISAAAQSPSPATMPSTPPAAPAASSDPRALEIADRVMAALGGREAWDATRYLQFKFGSEREGRFFGRSHVWDKWTGRYRVEGTTREGDPFLVLMNLNTKEGSAWLKGSKLAGADEKQQLERAWGMWVNDTYWLLMPYKMKDPGVTLSHAGEEKGENGATYDKVLLSFDNVGLTPKDRYWAFVNRETGLVDRWDYVLKGEDVPPTTWTWTDWKTYGRIKLAGTRTNAKDNRTLLLAGIAVPETVPDEVFTSPAPRP